ncbi:MAG TPA: glycosyltransferase family 39 protein [Verrucomicrobiae bacterium]|nr:glycosyltransferase family 39 protein [Verrucomicrobiae bacterium]
MSETAGATAAKSWKSSLGGAAVIILLTMLTYLPVMRGGFFWDDYVLVTDNQMVKAPGGLYRFWFTTEAPDYYPLTSSLLWLEWRAWGNNAPGYHLINVLLHAVSAVLVWLVLRRLRIPAAWLTALIFAVHPVNVATAGWISEQKSTLSMLFYATAVLLYLEFDEERHWRWYALSLAAFLLALLSKSAVVMLPVVLLACVWWRHGQVQRRDVAYSLPFSALSLVAGVSTVWFQYGNSMQWRTIRAATSAGRLAAAGWPPWFYLLKAVLPFHLMVVYPKWEIDPGRFVSWLPGGLLIVCFIVFWWKRKSWGRAALFGIGYFTVTLFPVLGFFDQAFYRFSLVADHWQYYSIVGVIALGVAAGERICGKIAGGDSTFVKAVASVVLLTALTATTWTRASLYADPNALWRDTIAKNPNARAVLFNP